MGNGSSKTADQAVAKADFPDQASEQVLVQAPKGKSATDPAFKAAVGDVVARLKDAKYVSEVESPVRQGQRRPALQGRPLRARDVQGRGRRRRRRRPRRQLVGRGRRRAEGSSRPARRAVRRRQCRQGAQRVLRQGLQARRDALAPDHAGDPDRAPSARSWPPACRCCSASPRWWRRSAWSPRSARSCRWTESIASVILLVGLAVGVDYSMFYLRREMEERDAGRSDEEALEFAAATSGRAVLVSGLTVRIAMAGMFIAGNAVFTSMAVGTIIVVAVAVLGSVTVLPARAAPSSATRSRRAACRSSASAATRNHGESRVWGGILDRVLARPVVVGGARRRRAARARLAGAQHEDDQPRRRGPPARTCRSCRPTTASRPRSPAARSRRWSWSRPTTSRRPRSSRASGDDRQGARHRPDVRAGGRPRSARTRRSRSSRSRCRATAPTRSRRPRSPRCATTSSRTTIGQGGRHADRRDRHDGRLEGLQRRDARPTCRRVRLRPRPRVPAPAGDVPLDRRPDQGDRAEPAVGRRALRRPRRSSSRTGTGESLLGFQSIGGITSWLPLFLFVILFGLSMDYHVFILSRIREAVDRGMPTDEAVATASSRRPAS